MEDSTLIKASLIMSLLGIFFLFVISDNIDLEYSDIGTIKNKDEGRVIRIKGVVKNIRNSDGLIIVEVMQEKSVPVIIFKESNSTLIKKNSFVEIEGEVRVYKGNPEIIADKVKTKSI